MSPPPVIKHGKPPKNRSLLFPFPILSFCVFNLLVVATSLLNRAKGPRARNGPHAVARRRSGPPPLQVLFLGHQQRQLISWLNTLDDTYSFCYFLCRWLYSGRIVFCSENSGIVEKCWSESLKRMNKNLKSENQPAHFWYSTLQLFLLPGQLRQEFVVAPPGAQNARSAARPRRPHLGWLLALSISAVSQLLASVLDIFLIITIIIDYQFTEFWNSKSTKYVKRDNLLPESKPKKKKKKKKHIKKTQTKFSNEIFIQPLLFKISCHAMRPLTWTSSMAPARPATQSSTSPPQVPTREGATVSDLNWRRGSHRLERFLFTSEFELYPVEFDITQIVANRYRLWFVCPS